MPVSNVQNNDDQRLANERLQLTPNSSFQSIRGTALAADDVAQRRQSALVGAAESPIRQAAFSRLRAMTNDPRSNAPTSGNRAHRFRPSVLVGERSPFRNVADRPLGCWTSDAFGARLGFPSLGTRYAHLGTNSAPTLQVLTRRTCCNSRRVLVSLLADGSSDVAFGVRLGRSSDAASRAVAADVTAPCRYHSW